MKVRYFGTERQWSGEGQGAGVGGQGSEIRRERAEITKGTEKNILERKTPLCLCVLCERKNIGFRPEWGTFALCHFIKSISLTELTEITGFVMNRQGAQVKFAPL